MKLLAKEIGLETEQSILVISFIGSDDTDYIFLSQDVDEINDDGSSLYIEIKDQKYGGYGLISELTMDKKELVFKLNSRGKEIMGTDIIEISVVTDAFNMEYLTLIFKKIIPGSGKLIIKS